MSKYDDFIVAIDEFRDVREEAQRYDSYIPYDPHGHIKEDLEKRREEAERKLDDAFHTIMSRFLTKI